MDLSEFSYELADRHIAQEPVEPRDSSRLLAAGSLTDHRFFELPDLLAPGDLVVVNDTRVRHARLTGHKRRTGGAVEALLLGVTADGRWEALVKPARRLRAGTELVFGEIEATVCTNPEEGRVLLELSTERDIEQAIEWHGEIPLPPYIHSSLDRADRYQTIYADRVGSAAAPTAGLHFTTRVLDRLADRGIDVARVELEVGLATFRPIVTERIEDHVIHRERISVSSRAAEQVADTRAHGGSIVAIGTTVVRALESVGRPDGTVEATSGVTDLYLKPGDSIDVVDRLVTNFHMPGSSLLVLLAAFMGPGWRDVYREALERGYRFLSFGDAMLCDRA